MSGFGDELDLPNAPLDGPLDWEPSMSLDHSMGVGDTLFETGFARKLLDFCRSMCACRLDGPELEPLS